MRQSVVLLLSIPILINAGCDWHLRNTTTMSSQIKRIIFDSEDPNSFLSQAIRKRLRFNGVELIDQGTPCQHVPLLRIINSSLRREISSIFQNGSSAGYQMVLFVNAEVLISSKDIHSISTKVCHLFFDNPQAALAKNIEQRIIMCEMYDKAAEQLIYKLFNIQLISKDTTTKYSLKLDTPQVSVIANG